MNNHILEKLPWIFGFIFLSGCSIFTKVPVQKEIQETGWISTDELIKTLSSDTFEGRRPGTAGMENASLYIESLFKKAGIQPFWNSSYRDTLSGFDGKLQNIIGIIPADSLTDEYILIGAHLDHIGKSQNTKDTVYNGANDNATGVTAVLQIARQLTQYKFSKNIIVAVFTGEEYGLLGSKHLAKNLKLQNIHLTWVINFEMIGVPLKNKPGKVYISGYQKSDFATVVNNLLDKEFIIFEKADTDYGLFHMADNYPFYVEYTIPSHTISTYAFNNYPYYHQLKDEYSELDINHMEIIITTMTEAIIKLLKSNPVIHLNE